MAILLAVMLIAAALHAQTPVEVKDALGRNTLQEAVFQFLEACPARTYAAERAKTGTDLARQLEDLLDDTPFDMTTLSRDAEGDQSDGLSAAFEHILAVQIGAETLELQLQRVELKRHRLAGFGRQHRVDSQSAPGGSRDTV